MQKFKWSVKRIIIQDIQVRTRFNPDVLENEQYAVVKGSFKERGNDPTFGGKKKVKQKEVTMMCFDRVLWSCLEIDARLNLTGDLSFGYGNTYLCIISARNTLGQDLTLQISDGFEDETPWEKSPREKEIEEENLEREINLAENRAWGLPF